MRLPDGGRRGPRGAAAGRVEGVGAAAGIQLSGLAKSFGEVRAVRGIDVDVAPGETVALLGPNGAGKSTTIDMLLGLLEPDAGTVSVFGAPAGAAIDAGRGRRDAPDRRAIRDLTVRELVAMMASLYPLRSASTRCSSSPGSRTSPGGGRRSSPAARPSACASPSRSSANPDLLVLDEPTVAMDVEGRHAFWATMRDFAARGKTVLFATHYLEEADAVRRPGRADGARRASSPTGRPTEIKAMVGTRTIRATLPGRRRSSELERAARRDARRAARRGGRARLHRLRRGDPRAARRATRTPATSRSPAPASSRRSSS